jgi:hypothetical protein
MKYISILFLLVINCNVIFSQQVCFTTQEARAISDTLDALRFRNNLQNKIITQQDVIIKDLELGMQLNDSLLLYERTQNKLLKENIELYKKIEKIQEPKWHQKPIVWFVSGIVTTLGSGTILYFLIK